MARIQVLNKQEILNFEEIIHLNLRERGYAFYLPTKLYDTALSFQNDNSFLKFTLLCKKRSKSDTYDGFIRTVMTEMIRTLWSENRQLI